ncbi:rust resistance kinase Lr10-like [Impatiens glandulifera]|uniref:rust resistance kinase Lr10-like n=1 Tax=Impatiens glandulifera TaxID=253017 RepID=UPI001FB078A6|nr:rust resistance kinase Lr10-like [Impatiens glandulifera]
MQADGHDHKHSQSKIIMIVVLSVISIFIFIGLVFFVNTLMEKKNKFKFRLDPFLEGMAMEKLIRFKSAQLVDCTNNYSTLLGSGGFGKVYLGQLPNGVQCAVKVLQRNLDRKTEEQFKAEVSTIGRTYHANLVKLYGFCYDDSLSALVYEYMKNGSLDKYLFRDNHSSTSSPMISWEKFYEIAVGTAKGLAYLHEDCQQRIIHYDIKPANILIDDNFSPKVADFGMAKLCNKDKTHVTMTGYRGTPGYSAPEFLLHNFHITYKSDVYSFGMLLFEILGRRKNTNMSATTSNLDWFPSCVWDKYEKGELEELTKSCKIEEAERERAQRLAKVALWCVQDSPHARPRMSIVVKMLEGEVEILPPPKPFSFMFSIRENTINSSKTSKEVDSNWYKDTSRIIFECEIQIDN